MPGSLWPLLIWRERMTPAQLELIKILLPGLLQISWGLNLMHSVRCCMEDKASCSASSSKDFNSLISTNSATLAPLRSSLGACWCPEGHPWSWTGCQCLLAVAMGPVELHHWKAWSNPGSASSGTHLLVFVHTDSVWLHDSYTVEIWVMFPGKLLVICTELRRESQPAANWCSPEERRRTKAIKAWLTPVVAPPGDEHLCSYPEKRLVNPVLQAVG